MADQNHIDEWDKGVQSWNQWRQGNPDIVPDLSGHPFENYDINNANLRGSKLVGCTITKYNFNNCDLEEACFDQSNISDSNFGADKLEKLSFVRANLKNITFTTNDGLHACVFNLATLNNVEFTDGKLVACDFLATKSQEKLSFESATLEKVNFSGANFLGASFKGATFKDCTLSRADLTGANFLGAKGHVFDQTNIRGAIHSPGADDGWSILRRKYTGVMMVLHITLATVFFLPYLASVVYWTGLNQVQYATSKLSGQFVAVGKALALSTQPAVRAAGTTLMRAKPPTPCFAEKCRNVSMAALVIGFGPKEPVFGFDTSILLFGMSLFMLVYNVFRALLTYKVVPLREEELITGTTPPIENYRWMTHIHNNFMRWAMWVALVVFLVNIGFLLTGTVAVPTGSN